ncbi:MULTISPECIES: DinB family protein [unclassified Streptomyces]|uniref:DinB family protein n=1 Tax=unclassified Streptomyces TaxID=2593676 RepID=UPI002E2CA646|nr:DinB family protein [Streptomyces sp. NBC_00223]
MTIEHGWQSLTLTLFRRVRREFVAAVEGLTDTALEHRLTPATNSVGWLAWHIARGQDRNLSELTGLPQLWLTDGWADRFGRPADPADTGFGHSAAAAAAFRSPGGATLLAYQEAAHGIAERCLAAAPDGDLGRVVVSVTLGNAHSVADRLGGQLDDCFAHLGQIALLESLRAGDPR